MNWPHSSHEVPVIDSTQGGPQECEGDIGVMASIEESRVRTPAVAYKQLHLLLSLLLLPAAGRLDFMPPIWAATVR